VATLFGVWVLQMPLVAVGIYHTGICFLMFRNRSVLSRTLKGFQWKPALFLSGFCLLVWPTLIFLWPQVALSEINLADQLQAWGFTGPMVYVFIFYSITIHPILEETFWRGLMPDHVVSDILFAGFHVLVMMLFLPWIWIAFGFTALTLAGFLWRKTEQHISGLAVPILSHALADLGIVLAVAQLVQLE
jgi:hypothetical protein